jgi:hypothetical protein
MQPPIARADNNRGLALFVQSASHRFTTLHTFTQKIIKALSCASFSKIFVAHGYNVDRVKFDGDIERLDTGGWLQNDLQRSLAAGG